MSEEQKKDEEERSIDQYTTEITVQLSMNLYLPGLCQSQSIEWAFWSESFTWDTPTPNLTQCFQKTVLQWIPCVFFFVGMLWYLPYLKRKRLVFRHRVSWLNIVKNVLSLVIVFLAAFDLIFTITEEIHGESPPLVLYLHPALSIITMVGVMFVTYYEYIKGIHTSGLIWYFWFLQFISYLLVFASQIMYLSQGTQESNRAITAIITSGIVLVQFILNSFADTSALDHATEKPEMNGEATPLLSADEMCEETTRHPPSPELRASFLAKLSFTWISKLLITAYKKPLTPADVWALLKRHTSKFISSRGEVLWKGQLKEIASKNRYRRDRSEQIKSDTYLLLREIREGEVEVRKKKMPSLLVSAVRMYGLYYTYIGFQKLIAEMIGFIQPQLLSIFVLFIGNSKDYTWHGYAIGLALFLSSLVRTFVMQHHLDNSYVLGMNMRTFAIAHIYRKALKLSSSARKDRTVGQIVNLMSVDAQVLQEATVYMNHIWTSPIAIIMALVFLWFQLGASSLAGLFIMVLLIPFNAFMAAKVKKYQSEQLKYKDQRIKLMTEILNGIKVLKLYSWERSFEQQIKDIREMEVKILRKAAYLNAATAIMWFCAPLLVSLGSFTIYTLTGNVLTSEKAFVSISLFNLMNSSLLLLPGAIAYTVQFAVSMGRINQYLCEEELDPNMINENAMARDALLIQDGAFAWSNEGEDVLKKVNVTVPDGKLVAVVGTVGSGKTSLISSILGEMVKRSGRITLKGRIGYVPQQAWCLNCTLQENILFGKPFKKRRYNDIIDACALRPDLEILDGGDKTEIGEKGLNLSGGQKQRISLARAVYQDADIYLLDDPLSAVDSHVGKHIFDKVIGPHGCLAGKTRIFVTHRINFLPKVDSILVMKDGVITETGSYSELLSKNGEFAVFLRQHLETEEDSGEDEEVEAADFKSQLRQSMKITSASDSEGSVSMSRMTSPTSTRRSHRRHRSSTKEDLVNLERQNKNVARLVKLEEAETGNVRMEVFMAYARAVKLSAVCVVFISFAAYLASQVGNSIWLSKWSEDSSANNDSAKQDYYLAIYGVLGASQMLWIGVQNIFLAFGTYYASIELHAEMLRAIMSSPMSFFDTTPIGRIINRLGKDIDIVDINIPLVLRLWFLTISGVFSTLIVISVASPVFIIAIIPLGILYFFAQRFYICTSRQLKRIESLRRSPIYSHFQETLVGVSSVRAYKRQNPFIDKSDILVDENQIVWYPNLVAYRWMGVALEGIGAIIVLLASVFAVLTRDTIGPGLAGASVSYALQVTMNLNYSVRMTCDLETFIIAVERIKEYIGLPSELCLENDGVESSWPAEGRVEFCDYSVRYRPGMDLVLRNISTEIHPGQRVGIIGRTGAGKSSLTLALFRILEPAEGCIKIDDVDITSLSLNTLRSRLTIIPQDPVLFSGTLRINLDPFYNHTDGEVWSALEQAHLREFVAGLPDGLEHECAEGGENLSVGQRQLVCLARALLRKTRVLVLDEATAAVDLETDDLIQSTIRSEFKDSTILTIAHRLNTIMDYDSIIVLDHGTIKETGSPSELLKDTKSIFHAMCHDAGLA